MDESLPVTGVVPIAQMSGDETEDTRLLQEMAEQARNFVASFSWCKTVKAMYFGDGIGGIIGIFFARVEPEHPDVDEWLWVIVGDLPPAYLVTNDCLNPEEAAEGYISEMRRWVDAAKAGDSLQDIIPVNVPATPEWAAVLERRLDALEHEVLPQWFTK